MAFSSCFTCFKYSVFLFNFLLWLLGLSLLAVGGWLLTEGDAGRYVEEATSASADPHTLLVISYSQATDTNLVAPLAYLFLISGAVLVLVAVVGCCGAVRDNVCLLVTLMILLSFVFVVLLSIGAWSFNSSKNVNMHTRQLQRLTNHTVKEAVDSYGADKDSQHFMDTIQVKLDCCGADTGAIDYLFIVPESCEAEFRDKPCSPLYFDYIAQHFERFVQDRLVLLAAVSTAFALCLILHMLCALLLCCAVRERTRSISV